MSPESPETPAAGRISVALKASTCCAQPVPAKVILNKLTVHTHEDAV